MAYLLTLGWPWFAAAFALGALVGFATTSQAKDSPAAPGWNMIAIAVALACLAAASWFGLVDGRGWRGLMLTAWPVSSRRPKVPAVRIG
jgi:hypothetical protein